ncbi:MAG: hypothetical protein AAF355_06740 [Myxococcota bacterium]
MAIKFERTLDEGIRVSDGFGQIVIYGDDCQRSSGRPSSGRPSSGSDADESKLQRSVQAAIRFARWAAPFSPNHPFRNRIKDSGYLFKVMRELEAQLAEQFTHEHLLPSGMPSGPASTWALLAMKAQASLSTQIAHCGELASLVAAHLIRFAELPMAVSVRHVPEDHVVVDVVAGSHRIVADAWSQNPAAISVNESYHPPDSCEHFFTVEVKQPGFNLTRHVAPLVTPELMHSVTQKMQSFRHRPLRPVTIDQSPFLISNAPNNHIEDSYRVRLMPQPSARRARDVRQWCPDPMGPMNASAGRFFNQTALAPAGQAQGSDSLIVVIVAAMCLGPLVAYLLGRLRQMKPHDPKRHARQGLRRT